MTLSSKLHPHLGENHCSILNKMSWQPLGGPEHGKVKDITISTRTPTQPPKKKYQVGDFDKWWVGDSDEPPERTYPGETNPLYAVTHPAGRCGCTIEEFARGELKQPDLGAPGMYQISRTSAALYTNWRLGRAPTQEQLDEKCKEFEGTESEIAIRRWHKASEKIVGQEVNLALLKNKIRLKFIPIPSSRENKWRGKERGRYKALVTIEDKKSIDHGKTILYHPTNDWVEENFTKESLAVVQAVARETETVYKLQGTSKTEKGFLPLSKKMKYKRGQVDLQISKIRYIPQREIKNALGETVLRSEAWHGLIQTRRDDVAEQIALDHDWVLENIDANMRKFLKEVRVKDGFNGFVFIPEGDNEAHAPGVVQFLANAPNTQYHNKELGSRRCLLDSAASGLFFKGYKRLASMIEGTANDPEVSANAFDYLGKLLQNDLDKSERRSFEYIALNKTRLKSWNTLESPKDYLICIVGIRSSDGKTDHAICIAGGWIFDSNFERALPLTEESLNFCSSSDERSTKFVECTRGHLLRIRK